jgi:hypothetical protein
LREGLPQDDLPNAYVKPSTFVTAAFHAPALAPTSPILPFPSPLPDLAEWSNERDMCCIASPRQRSSVRLHTLSFYRLGNCSSSKATRTPGQLVAFARLPGRLTPRRRSHNGPDLQYRAILWMLYYYLCLPTPNEARLSIV